MSDFTSNFWSVYVAGISIFAIVACVLLLWFTSRTKATASADNTTGHVWDGDLREMNNPLPRWWVGLFIITIVFSCAYLYLYPGLGSFPGVSGWTSRGQLDAEVAKGDAEVAPLYAKFKTMSVEEISRDPQAHAIGERLFMNTCSPCHGSDARGGKGFPNLTSGFWLHGGKPDDIIETITHGRIGQMPPMAAAVGSADDVKNVANYVLALSGNPHDSVRAELGKEKFVVCAACHGADGKGNQQIGSANFTANLWLHGFGEQAIMNMVNNGKTNIMPPQGYKFTPDQIRVVAAYVWGLTNNAPAK